MNWDNELKNRYTHIRWKTSKQDIEISKQDIHTRKQDIEISKQDIQTLKQDIEIPDTVSSKTKQNIYRLFEEYGSDQFFGRSEVINVLNITASPASSLIKKMLDMDIICPVKGHGKGKYKFL